MVPRIFHSLLVTYIGYNLYRINRAKIKITDFIKNFQNALARHHVIEFRLSKRF